eukprot:5056306-Prymnesium_polylepis.1
MTSESGEAGTEPAPPILRPAPHGAGLGSGPAGRHAVPYGGGRLGRPRERPLADLRGRRCAARLRRPRSRGRAARRDRTARRAGHARARHAVGWQGGAAGAVGRAPGRRRAPLLELPRAARRLPAERADARRARSGARAPAVAVHR